MDKSPQDITLQLDEISSTAGVGYENRLYEKSFYKYPLIMNYALLTNKIVDYERSGSTEDTTADETNIKRYLALFEIETLLFNYLSAAKMFEDNTYCFLKKHYCNEVFLKTYEEYHLNNIKKNTDCRFMKDLRNLGVHKTSPAIFLQTKETVNVVATDVLFNCKTLLEDYDRWSSTSRSMLMKHKDQNKWLSVKVVAASHYTSLINIAAFLDDLLAVHHADDIAEIYALRESHVKIGSPRGHKFPFVPVNDILQAVEKKYVG